MFFQKTTPHRSNYKWTNTARTPIVSNSLSLSLSLFAFGVFPFVNQNRRCETFVTDPLFPAVEKSPSPISRRGGKFPRAEEFIVWNPRRADIYTRDIFITEKHRRIRNIRETKLPRSPPRFSSFSFPAGAESRETIFRAEERGAKEREGQRSMKFCFREESALAPRWNILASRAQRDGLTRITLATSSCRIFSTFIKSQISEVLQEETFFLLSLSLCSPFGESFPRWALLVSFLDEHARERGC